MKLIKNLFNKYAGFTLIELMATVTIVGALAVVATPSFNKYKEKIKQIEAKSELARIYSLESAFYSSSGFYALCLDFMGYDRDYNDDLFYRVGFAKDLTHSVSPVPGCTHGDNRSYFAANAAAYGRTPPTVLFNTGGSQEGSGYGWGLSTFRAGATGFISETGTDAWTVDQDKVISNVQSSL